MNESDLSRAGGSLLTGRGTRHTDRGKVALGFPSLLFRPILTVCVSYCLVSKNILSYKQLLDLYWTVARKQTVPIHTRANIRKFIEAAAVFWPFSCHHKASYTTPTSRSSNSSLIRPESSFFLVLSVDSQRIPRRLYSICPRDNGIHVSAALP